MMQKSTMHAQTISQMAEKNDHFNVRSHANETEAQKSRSNALIAHANECCPCPLPGGSACRQCVSCNLILSKTCQEDGLMDDWCEYFEDMPCVRFRALDRAFIFDYTVAPLNPGTVGAIYTPGVSQVAIFTPAPTAPYGVQTYSTLSIVTLQSLTFTDFPTPTSLAAGQFAIYSPYGFGVNSATPINTTFGLSNVTQANLAVFSNSYASLAAVPAYLMNLPYKVYGTSTATTTTLVALPVKMFETGWYMSTPLVMTSTTLSVADAFENQLKIENLVAPLGFWQLAVSTMKSIHCVRFKYVKAIYTSHKRCYACTNNSTRGCNGSRCGTVTKRAMFSRDNTVIGGMEDRSNYVASVSDVAMLERVLNESDKSFSGLSISPKSFRIVPSVVGDNLVFCPKRVLRKAIQVAKQKEREIQMIPSVESEVKNEHLTRYMFFMAKHQQLSIVQKLDAMRIAKQAEKTGTVSAATAVGTAATQKPQAKASARQTQRSGGFRVGPQQSSIFDGNLLGK